MPSYADMLLARTPLPAVEPMAPWDREPWLYQGEVRNSPERPVDRFQQSQAEMLSPTLGGYGMGQMAGETYLRGRGGDYAGAAEIGLPMAAMAFIPGAPKGKGIRAYHGSPHDFDRFDASKIGSGEGAQAYGHGLYFAESEGVARAYRDNLTDGYRLDASGDTPQAAAARGLTYHKGDRAAAIADLDRNATALDAADMGKKAQDYRAAIEMLKDENWTPGRLYEVNIKADPEQFLDWDKPLSEQPQAVRDALLNHPVVGPRLQRALAEARQSSYDKATYESIGVPSGVADENALFAARNADPTGAELHAMMRGWRDRGKIDAASVLQEQGIPGIRYKDAMSRGRDTNAAAIADLKAQGFNTDDVWYHVTPARFDKFSGETYLTKNAAEARQYALKHGDPNVTVLPVYVRGKIAPYGTRVEDAIKQGYVGRESRAGEINVFDGAKDAVIAPRDEGTSNYVVFPGNEHLIEIVKKYGIAGAAAMLGMSQSDIADAMEGREDPPSMSNMLRR